MIQAPLILASGSPRRRDLLKACGIQLASVVPSQIPEIRHSTESPQAYTQRLAREKSLAGRHAHAYVLAADTIVCLDDRVFEKPIDDRAAEHILQQLSGQWHRVITAWAIAFHPQEQSQRPHIVSEGYCISEVKFRQLQPPEIQSYIQTGEGSDKAGSYGIQGIGAALVESIRGDYSNIVGLPITDIIRALDAIGIRPTVEPS